MTENQKEKSVLERVFGGGGNQNPEDENAWYKEKLSSIAPWLVESYKENKKRHYRFNKRNSLIVLGTLVALLIAAAIWDNSGNKEVGKADSGLPEIKVAMPSVNPEEIKSNPR